MIADSKTDFKCLTENLQFFCAKPYLKNNFNYCRKSIDK